MTSRTSNLEREVKFDVDLDFTVPDLRDLAETRVLPTEDLLATYYDSDDLRLWSRGVTLRHRRSEVRPSDRGVWTLKLPRSFTADLLERAELTWPGEITDVPEEARTIVKGLVRHHQLSPLVELESRRRRLKLQRGGIPLGELDDDRVTIHGGIHDGLQFRQIELELASPDVRLPAAIVQRLRSCGASTDRAGPKLARALGEADRASASDIRLDRQSVLGTVVRRSVQRAMSGILEHDVAMRLRAEPPSPHDVHKTRVATRRLRSDLKTLRSILDPVWTRHLRADLKWLGAALGELRDIDVLTQYLEDARRSTMVDNEGAAILLTQLHRQRDTAGQALATVLDSERYLTLLDKLDAATENPPFLTQTGGGHRGRNSEGLARKHLPALTRKAWKKLDTSIQQSERDPTDRSLHQVRIRAKQVRYAAELAEPVIGPPAQRMAKAAQRVQDLLGTHQDAVVTDRWLHDQIGGGVALADFAAGQLSADQRHRRSKARKRWPKARRDIRREKLRRWMQ